MAILEKNKSWVKNKNIPDPVVVIAPANTWEMWQDSDVSG